MRRRSALAVATALMIMGCAFPQTPIAVPGGTVVQATTDAMQYRAPLPRDVHRGSLAPLEATGESCRMTLTFPPSPPDPFLGSNAVAGAIPWKTWGVTFGDESFATAAARARKSAGGALLYDLRVDVHTTAVLGIWVRECLEIHALAAR